MKGRRRKETKFSWRKKSASPSSSKPKMTLKTLPLRWRWLRTDVFSQSNLRLIATILKTRFLFRQGVCPSEKWGNSNASCLLPSFLLQLDTRDSSRLKISALSSWCLQTNISKYEGYKRGILARRQKTHVFWSSDWIDVDIQGLLHQLVLHLWLCFLWLSLFWLERRLFERKITLCLEWSFRSL